MVNPLRIPKSPPFDLLPGDIDLKETPDEMFYNLLNDNWVSYRKYSEKSKIFHRKEYLGPIPFEFPEELLRENKLNLGTYFLGRNGSWNDQNLKKIASMYEQRLSNLLHDSIVEVLSQLSDHQNANYYDPLIITHRILNIK